ncbi:MAG: hypothetical protein L3K15_05380 [Thermoplasmata archaeon]|nr:hypothetical protein [Thermoplasmata archaeon]
MTAQVRRADRLEEPVPADRTTTSTTVVGRIRLPLTVTHRPWATLHRTATGELYWIVRLWIVDRPVERRVATSTLRDYAVESRLPILASTIDQLIDRAFEVDAGC